MKFLKEELKVLYKNPTELKKKKKNSRTHSKKQIQQIAQSINTLGFNNPVLIDKNNSWVKNRHDEIELERLPILQNKRKDSFSKQRRIKYRWNAW